MEFSSEAIWIWNIEFWRLFLQFQFFKCGADKVICSCEFWWYIFFWGIWSFHLNCWMYGHKIVIFHYFSFDVSWIYSDVCATTPKMVIRVFSLFFSHSFLLEVYQLSHFLKNIIFWFYCFLFLTSLIFFSFFFFSWPHPWHMQIPGPQIESELQLWCKPQLRQHQLLNSLHQTMDWTCATTETTQTLNHSRNSWNQAFLKFIILNIQFCVIKYIQMLHNHHH